MPLRPLQPLRCAALCGVSRLAGHSAALSGLFIPHVEAAPCLLPASFPAIERLPRREILTRARLNIDAESRQETNYKSVFLLFPLIRDALTELVKESSAGKP